MRQTSAQSQQRQECPGGATGRRQRVAQETLGTAQGATARSAAVACGETAEGTEGNREEEQQEEQE
jgi:hypothetical protein